MRVRYGCHGESLRANATRCCGRHHFGMPAGVVSVCVGAEFGPGRQPARTYGVENSRRLFRRQHLAFAAFGGLFGTIVAWAIEYPSTLGNARVIALLRRCCGLATSPARRIATNFRQSETWLKSAEQPERRITTAFAVSPSPFKH